MRQELHRTADLAVRFVCPPGAGHETCFVTFDSFTNLETLDRPGFGETFFEGRGIPAIHILSRRNRWYQEPGLPAALEAAAEAARPFGRVFAYGSSMGGYGAIRFGAAAGATTAIAISPQYTIDRTVMPDEIRWASFSAATTFGNEALPFPKVDRAFVFYDPHDLDRLHVERLGAEYSVQAIRLPFAGHPAGAYLSETGLLQKAIEEIHAGAFDPVDFEKRARERRGFSGQYLFTLSRLQPLVRMRLKLALARSAVGVAPNDPEYKGYLGFVLAHSGRIDEAERALREAAEDGSDQPLALERYGRFLLWLGRLPEAAPLLERAMFFGRELPRVQRSYALLLLAQGRWKPALRLLSRVARRHPKLRRLVAREIAAVLAWTIRRRGPATVGASPTIRLNMVGDIRLRRRPFASARWFGRRDGRVAG